MPLKDISDYDKLKNALLRRFEMTEEGFRRRFHIMAVTQVQQSPDDESPVGMSLATTSTCCFVKETHECKRHAIRMGRLRCLTIGSTKLLVEECQ